jgi:DNA invertase Pin-like site-specific DNA recombinase
MSFSVEAAGVGLEWVTWILVSAAGGVLALVFAVAVGAAYRRRHREPSGAAVSHAALDATRARAGAGTQNGDGAWTTPPAAAGAPRGSDSSLRLSPGSALIGYITVAADADEDRASALAIEATCQHFGWELVELVSDPDAGGALERRGLRYALERIADGHAHGLVVSDLQRVSRSLIDLGALMAWFRDAGATLIALDLDLDTSTAEGRHVAATLIALSAHERQRIASGTRRGLAKGRAGGRPAVSDRPELVERIATMRAANMTLQAIADQLNDEDIPTLRGGKQWRPSSIQAALGYRRPRPRDQLPSPQARASHPSIAGK